MKVIFLDIDGVLNSSAYDRVRRPDEGNIDITRLQLLKQLTDATGARIVLTSTWRKHWEEQPAPLDEAGKELVSTFGSAGLEIYSKTPIIGYIQRAQEIREWLSLHPDVDGFVILDDSIYDWGDMTDRFVQTNYRIGRGLEQEHIDRALELLK